MKMTLFTRWTRLARAVLSGLLLSLWVFSTAAQAETTEIFDLQFEDLAGQMQPLAPYKGKPLVVNFWATWCPPCIKEMPDLESLSQTYSNVQFVGLAIDTQRNVKKFLEKVPVSYDLYVPGHSGVKHMRELGNPKAGLPFTLVIAADGTVEHQLLGPINKADLGAILDSFKN